MSSMLKKRISFQLDESLHSFSLLPKLESTTFLEDVSSPRSAGSCESCDCIEIFSDSSSESAASVTSSNDQKLVISNEPFEPTPPDSKRPRRGRRRDPLKYVPFSSLLGMSILKSENHFVDDDYKLLKLQETEKCCGNYEEEKEPTNNNPKKRTRNKEKDNKDIKEIETKSKK